MTSTTAQNRIPDSDGTRTPTLNNTGFSWAELSPVTKAWTTFSGPGPALEIGACYGDATIAALEDGRSVLANDLSELHLKLLQKRVSKDLSTRLKVMPGAFPEELDLKEGSLGSVHASSVFHFLTGEQLECGFEKISRWLHPGGKVFIVAETPFMGIFRNLDYEGRKDSMKYPGLMTQREMARYSPFSNQLPAVVNWLDMDVLQRLTKEAGLIVESLEYFTRPSLPDHLRWDGRESIGLVARRR